MVSSKQHKRPAADNGSTMRAVRQRISGSDRDVEAGGLPSRGSEFAMHVRQRPTGSDRDVAVAHSTSRGSELHSAGPWTPITHPSCNDATAVGERAGSERGANADEAPLRGSDGEQAKDTSSVSMSERPTTALAALQAQKVWRPKSQHCMAPDKKCWSCVAGGFAAYSSAGRDDTCNCCRACCTDRSCTVCHTFNDDLQTPWCSKCENRIALWCAACNGSKLGDGLCRHCSETSTHKRMLEVPDEFQTERKRRKPSDFCKNGCLTRNKRPRKAVRQGFARVATSNKQWVLPSRTRLACSVVRRRGAKGSAP